MKYRASTVRALGIIRLLVGVTTFVAPRLAPRSMGITQPDRDGGTVARMFAIRDAGLALATLSAEPAVRDTGLRLGVLADAADTISVVLGSRSGVTRGGVALIGGAAALFTLAGVTVWPRSKSRR
ncbi:hypothetical protein [Nocardia carnea]|uniref:hypothetical protein n=1 Tax=Nocardia carnea TaxID=37328 RepID=UPI00245540F9|nr:hypothetical protein [Nocardia carnea]